MKAVQEQTKQDTKPKAERRDPDVEMKAMRRMIDILEDLPPAARYRVMRYVENRFEEREMKAPPEPNRDVVTYGVN